MTRKDILTLVFFNLAVAMVSFLGIYFLWLKPDDENFQTTELEPAFHQHIDFKLVLNDDQFNFSKPAYQSDEVTHLDEFIHLHDFNGDVLHLHQPGATIASGFKALGFQLDENCVITDQGTKFCQDQSHQLVFFVNGSETSAKAAYQLQDLDQVLVWYGPNSQDAQQYLSQISNDACIYSEKCPEKGTPPTESCVGSLGTKCH